MATTPKDHIDLQILKYLQKSSSSEEREFLENWINQADANKQYFEDMKSIWKGSTELTDFDKIDIDKHWQVFKARTESSTKSKPLLTPLLKIAASIVVLLSITYIINSVLFDKVSLIAETGEENRFMLPDQSVIWLREGSTVTYKKDFKGSERAIELVGEGYFDIKKNPPKPFVVHAGNTRTEVLGTSFNLGTNTKTKETTLVLIEGKVAFSSGENKEILVTGEKITATSEGLLIKEKNNDLNVDAWKSGILKFDNTSFNEVIAALEKYYNYTFTIENKELLTCALTTRFQDQSLEEVLNTLKILFGIDYSIEQDDFTVLISNGGC